MLNSKPARRLSKLTDSLHEFVQENLLIPDPDLEPEKYKEWQNANFAEGSDMRTYYDSNKDWSQVSKY